MIPLSTLYFIIKISFFFPNPFIPRDNANFLNSIVITWEKSRYPYSSQGSMSSTSTVVHVPSLHSRIWYAPSWQIVLVIITLSTSSGRSANTASALRNLQRQKTRLENGTLDLNKQRSKSETSSEKKTPARTDEQDWQANIRVILHFSQKMNALEITD